MTERDKNIRHHIDSNHDMENLIDNLNRKDDVKYNRRAFIKATAAASVALGLATTPFGVMRYLKQGNKVAEKLEISKLDDIKMGEARIFNYPTESDPAILIRTQDDTLVAYNNKCTHLQCPVVYEHKENILLCPCHKGYFNVMTGHPVAGPPQRELPKIQLQIENGTVYAVGREIRHG